MTYSPDTLEAMARLNLPFDEMDLPPIKLPEVEAKDEPV